MNKVKMAGRSKNQLNLNKMLTSQRLKKQLMKKRRKVRQTFETKSGLKRLATLMSLF